MVQCFLSALDRLVFYEIRSSGMNLIALNTFATNDNLNIL